MEDNWHNAAQPEKPLQNGGAGDPTSGIRSWPQWIMLGVLGFLALECLVLAAVFQGGWFILLAPAAVCAIKAADLWRDLRPSKRR